MRPTARVVPSAPGAPEKGTRKASVSGESSHARLTSLGAMIDAIQLSAQASPPWAAWSSK